MPRMPDKFDLGQAPGGGGRALATVGDWPRDAGGAGALASVAKGVAEVSGALVAKQEEADDYEVQKRIVEFDLEQEKRLDEAKRSAAPEAKGFTDSYRSGYDMGARDLMKSIPDRLKPKVDEMLVKRGASFEKRAYDFELAERDRWNVQDVNTQTSDLVTRTMGNPDSLEDNAQRGVALIRSSKLTQRAKVEAERKFLDMNAEFGIQAMIDREIAAGRDAGDVIERLRKVPKGSLLPGLPASGRLSGAGPRFSPEIDGAIEGAAAEHGVDPAMLRVFAKIESGGDPSNRTGSYKGLFQLSDSEFRKAGGRGDIYDPVANAKAAAIKLKAEGERFREKFGREPSPAELYLVHQQGEAGAAAHLSNPDRPAWENMAGTGEGRQKGARWAKQAIWGNIPDADKRRFGSVENVSSAEFVALWESKVNRFAGAGETVDRREMGGPTRLAEAKTGTATDAGPGAVASDEPRQPKAEVDAEGRVTLTKTDDRSDIPGGPQAGAPVAQSDDLIEADDAKEWTYLSPKVRRKLINYARTAGRAVVDKKVDDDIARLRLGKEPELSPDGKSSLDLARAHLTNMQWEKKRQAWDEARLEHRELSTLRDLSDTEAADHVASIVERAEKAGLSVESAAKVQKKADQRLAKTIQMRNTDPVRAITGSIGDEPDDRTPPLSNTAAAIKRIAESRRPEIVTGPGGVPVPAGAPREGMAPQQQWATLFEGRLADQAQVMPYEPEKHRIISRKEAERLLMMPKDGKGLDYRAYRERLEAAAVRAEQKFGPKYAKRALEEAIGFHLDGGSSDFKNAQASLIRKMARGEAISGSDVRALTAIESVDKVSLSSGIDTMARIDRAGRSQGMPAIAPMGDAGRPAIGQGMAQPNDRQVEWLRSNPDGWQVFDQRFGAGSAARILGPQGADPWGKARGGVPKRDWRDDEKSMKPKATGWTGFFGR